jgi:hypothetical protein
MQHGLPCCPADERRSRQQTRRDLRQAKARSLREINLI